MKKLRKIALQYSSLLQNQTRFVVGVENRDRPKRLIVMAVVSSICLMMGLPYFVIGFVIAVVIAESQWAYLLRILPEEGKPMRNRYYASVGYAGWFAVVTYVTPSFALITLPSSAMLALSLMWLFGVYIHISNTFSAFPIHTWLLMTPAYSCAFILFWMASNNPGLPAAEHQWLLVSALMFVFILNSVETLSRQRTTRRALRKAERAATERLAALEHISRHDQLTGLLNRSAFDAAVCQALKNDRIRAKSAVIMIDLDGFKPINDTYGHETGDLVLKTVAARLNDLIGESGVAARVGGDEFSVLLKSVATEQAALRMANYVLRDLLKPIPYKQTKLQIGASIGVALETDGENTVESLCTSADQAMYRAKADSDEKVLLYRSEDFPRRLTLDDRERFIEALNDGTIRPFYQPKVDILTGETTGFEALARWITPDGNQRRPGAFLPAINELRLQMSLLKCITSRALHDVQTLLDAGLDPGEVSINVPEVALASVSGRRDLELMFEDYPQAREHITLEITEDVFIARAADQIRESIRHFRSTGLRISLDDFGTGFASFQHLQNLDFDELKVDTSFVREIEDNGASRVLVVGFAYLAAGLGVSIVAEGVENEAQLKFLEKVGYRVAQGYYFSQAIPFEDARARIEFEQLRAGLDDDTDIVAI